MRKGYWWSLGALALCGLVGWLSYQFARSGIQKQADNQAIAGVITASFAKARDLRVGGISGDVQASSTDSRLVGRLVSTATLRAPYTVDYFVDLGKVRMIDAAWNSRERVLHITIPEVQIGSPNINVAGMTLEQKGLFVTRAASAQLVKSAVGNANGYAVKRAQQPDFFNAARENGRQAVKELLERPLQATGRSDIRVAVRYESEGRSGGPSMDGSTPIADVLAAAQRE